MNALYHFQEGNNFDYNLKNYLNAQGVELEYETRLSNLLTKIVSLRPGIVFIDENLDGIENIINSLFHKDSPFYVPLVIVIRKDVDKSLNISLENFVELKDELKSTILPKIIEKAKLQQKFNLKKSLFPFTKFDEITSILFKIGFSIKNQGTVYIKDCISYFLCDVGNFSYNLGKVYGIVSAMHSTVPTNIERCIRIAINNVWKNLKPEIVAERIGVDPIFFQHKPTCREIVLFIGELILDKAKELMFSNDVPINKYKLASINC